MLMRKNIEILPIIKELSNNSCSQSSFNLLIENSFRICRIYLYTKRLKIYKSINGDEPSFQDLVISAIAPLFCKDSAEQVLPIVKEFNSWQPTIQTEDDAFYFLNKIIAGRVEQHISHLFKEQDPFFAKILDSVNYLIKKGGYKKVSHFGKRYIVPSTCDEIKGKVIDQDSFEKLPTVLFQNRKTLLINIFVYLEDGTEFFPAIPINSLVIRIRNISGIALPFLANDFNFSSKFDIDEIVNMGLCHALKKLDDTYCTNGKLDKAESECFKRALKDMAEDLKDGGVNRGLYDYLKQHIIELEKINYQNKYHNILEYLLKVMKSTIREKLTEERI